MLLSNANSFLWPVQLRGDIEIHEYGIVIVEVNRVRKLRELLCARAVAAPERIERLGVNFGVTVSQRQVVDGCPGFRIDRAHAVVEQHAFVVIHVVRLRRPCKQMPRQLHHVIGATVFGRL